MTTDSASLERAAIARLLSIGFSPPDATTVGELRELASALSGDTDDTSLHQLVVALSDPGVATELPMEFEAIFGGQVACPPYEGSYEADPFRGTRQMADAAGFYRAFGTEPSGPAAERPDHIACQLEFLAFVEARRFTADAAGDTDESQICAEAADEFVRSHLARFMVPFCRSVAETTASPVYRSLARIGARFIVDETARCGITPRDVPRPPRTAVEVDEVACGTGECSLHELMNAAAPSPMGAPEEHRRASDDLAAEQVRRWPVDPQSQQKGAP
jgi:TorA maturation chaperone TorD